MATSRMLLSRDSRLTGPLGISALLHLTLIGLFLWTTRAEPPMVLPPVYKVNIVAAPPGPRAIGEVTSAPAPAKPAPTPPKSREVAPTAPKAPPKKATATAATKATPTNTKAKPSTSAAPKAGGGPTGGKGSDVITLQTEGLDFPYPGYLNNIVRQIALNFHPKNPNAPLKAEVAFLIHRDGSMTNFRFLTRSGVYAFDLEARGAVEKAASGFGPLPSGFGEDVLPVVFSFDPKFWR